MLHRGTTGKIMKIQTITEMKKVRKEARNAKLPKAQKKPDKSKSPGRDGNPIKLQDVGGIVMLFDENAGAFEALRFSNLLNDPTGDNSSDIERQRAHEWGDIRRHMLETFHGLQSRCENGALKSVDWSRVGSSGFGPTSLSAARYAAFSEMGSIMEAIPSTCRQAVEKVVINDIKTWEIPSKAAKRKALEEIRFALDMAAFKTGAKIRSEIHRSIGRNRLVARWPDHVASIDWMAAWMERPLKDRAEAIRRTVRTSSGNRA